MWFFKRREIYHGFDEKQFYQVREQLSLHKIKYDCRIINHGNRSNRRSSFGINIACQYEYYIYVAKGCYEEAEYLLRK